MQHEFRRVAIVNRGHVAMRFIHSVRELAREDGTDVRTIAIYTDPDRGALYVREADEAYALGAASFVDPRDGRRKSRYVDRARMREVLLAARAEAAWVGWGYVPEHLEFAELCGELGIRYLGPSLPALRTLADKIATKRLAHELGIPVVPWSDRGLDTREAAQAAAAALGYPVLVKAAFGGAGRTLALARDAASLASAFAKVRAEAARTLVDPSCFVEKHLGGARLVAVQILADAHGTVWDVGLREGTVQLGFGKVLDESPPPALPEPLERRLRAWSVSLMKAARYEGAGSVEFLVDASGERAWLLEVNPRLETAHDVVEATTGLDLVKHQILVARGERLVGAPPSPRGHAFEVRVRAEDESRGFAPAPGLIDAFRAPMGPGIRVEASVADGDEVPPGLSTMIAKLVAHGRTRAEALARMERALRESLLVVRGGASNKSFLSWVCGREEVRAGPVDVDWLDRAHAQHAMVSLEHAHFALVAAAIEQHDAQLGRERAAFLASATRGRPTIRPEIGRTVELKLRGQSYRIGVSRQGGDAYAVEIGGLRRDARYERQGRFERRLSIGGATGQRIVASDDELGRQIEIDGVAHRIYRDDGGIVRAPAPGIVQGLAVKAGDVVARGAPLLVLEAMKMEMTISAPFAGRVREVFAVANVPVPTGGPLLFLEGTASTTERFSTERVLFPSAASWPTPAAPPKERLVERLGALRQLMLGYDVDASEAKRLAAECAALAAELDAADAIYAGDDDVLRAERAVLRAFVDVGGLFRRRPGSDTATDDEVSNAEEYLITFLRTRDPHAGRLPAPFLAELRVALAHYDVTELEPSARLEEALFWIFKSHQRAELQHAPVVQILERWLAHAETLAARAGGDDATLLDGVMRAARGRHRGLVDLAAEVAHRFLARPAFERARAASFADAEHALSALSALSARSPHEAQSGAGPAREDEARAALVQRLVECPYPLADALAKHLDAGQPIARALTLEVLTARYYRARKPSGLGTLATATLGGLDAIAGSFVDHGVTVRVVAAYAPFEALATSLRAASAALRDEREVVELDLYVRATEPSSFASALEPALAEALRDVELPRCVRRVSFVASAPGELSSHHRTFTRAATRTATHEPGAFVEQQLHRGLHPTIAERLHLDQLREFEVERRPSATDLYVYRGVARSNPKDERLFVFAEVRDLSPVRDAAGVVVGFPHFERLYQEAVASLRVEQAQRPASKRLHWNRFEFHFWPPIELSGGDLRTLCEKLAPATDGLGLEKVVLRARLPDPETGVLRERAIHVSKPTGMSLGITELEPDGAAIAPLSEYEQKVVRLRQRGLVYPHEVVRMLTPDADGGDSGFPRGDFRELDLADSGEALVEVTRPAGHNAANVIVGLLRNYTPTHPEGMERVVILGDPSRNLGALAEPECRRIMAALDLAERTRVPLEWFALSSGARIAMDSGTENMDWIAAVLRRIIDFTQAGGEVNVVVMGINVGAQPYWNAEATMLMHTRGILIMMPHSAMVLTGKRALDYSGGLSAEDDLGIGGYDRIMGVNGQAQYFARDVADAGRLLLRHYEHTYVAPGERFPRRAPTDDPAGRDVSHAPHALAASDEFATVGDVFSEETNAGRKKPFHVRRVMSAAIDRDHAPLERWADMRDAEVAVVWDAHLGGHPVCLIGLESEPIARLPPIPADGPEQWTGGTLFPLASKKVARAINAASMNRPVVILANLSGFDGSPESMRNCQLEYGAEIGRAVVNFRGPIVFCVISRFHGGAYVVFSRTLNENLEVTALEGTFASVIGGAPAAGVVFAGEVEARARADARVKALAAEIAAAPEGERRRLRAQLEELTARVRAEKVGEIAEEFDHEHSVQRALRVGSLHKIIPAPTLRPYLIDAIERGMARELARVGLPK
jgi:acetyl/propionyl-CoA carboxylase alpha subunit/acetyl-CoA carboxylase carboxyltransferase component